MHSPTMQAFNHEYASYLKYLVSAGILECDNQYIPEHKSKGYRFTVRYRNSDLTKITITNKSLIKKWEAANFSGKKEHPHLVHWFNYKLRLNTDRAAERNEQFFHEYRNQYDDNLLRKYEYNKLRIAEFAAQHYFFRKDDFAGRIHSNLSNLPKIFRPFVKYDKQPLVSVDIKNCQPYLLTRILQPDFFSKLNQKVYRCGLLYANVANMEMLENKQRETRAAKKRKGKIKLAPKKLRTRKQAVAQIKDLYEKLQLAIAEIPQPELQAYRGAALDGSLYELFMQQYALKHGKTITRKLAKQFFLKILFSSPNWKDPHDTAGKLLFSQMFPAIFEVIERSKSIYKNHLSCLLQSMEADIILHRVVPRIAREKPNLPLFTIHDSIVTTEGNQEYVKTVLLEESLEAIGFYPVTSIEFWREETVQLPMAA